MWNAETRLRQRRLPWFGHVKRSEDIIKEVLALSMEGLCPPGRPLKT